jgi:guanylate kinase
MNHNTIYLVVGASGSGKTYIVDKICKDFDMKQVNSRTTRKPRYEGEIGHKFVTNEIADKEFETAIAKTNYNGYRYYTTVEDLEEADFYVIDPEGVRSFDYSRVSKFVRILFINSPWYIRAFNMFRRGDKIKDIINRLSLDRKEFKGFNSGYHFKSSNQVYRYFVRNKEIHDLSSKLYNEMMKKSNKQSEE